MPRALTVLVGAMTSTATSVAQAAPPAAEDEDRRIEVKPMDGLDPGVYADGGLYRICTPACGPGECPDNAKGLYASLGAARAGRALAA